MYITDLHKATEGSMQLRFLSSSLVPGQHPVRKWQDKITKIDKKITRITTQSVACNRFPVESFLPTRYCKSGEITLALSNLLLEGTRNLLLGQQLLSDLIKSARSYLNKQDSCLLTCENSKQVIFLLLRPL